MFIFVRIADNFLLNLLVYYYNKHSSLEKSIQNISILEVKNFKKKKNKNLTFLKKKILKIPLSLINTNNLFLFYSGEQTCTLYSKISSHLLANWRWELVTCKFYSNTVQYCHIHIDFSFFFFTVINTLLTKTRFWNDKSNRSFRSQSSGRELIWVFIIKIVLGIA